MASIPMVHAAARGSTRSSRELESPPMAKQDARANLRNTRTQMNNAATSAQVRAFKERQLAKQKREAEERKLRAALAAAERAKAEAARAAPETDEPDAPPKA